MFIRLSLFQKILGINCNRFNKQQKLDPDTKAIQQISFPKNLKESGCSRMFFIIEETKETVLDFSKGTIKVL